MADARDLTDLEKAKAADPNLGQRERVAYVLNEFVHNYASAYLMAGSIILRWDDLKREMEDGTV